MYWEELQSHLRHLSAAQQRRVRRAYDAAVKAHEGQLRKSGEPYVTHCIAVAHILADMEADADTLCAALLHDSVEDTDTTLEDIEEQFDGNVALLIDGVTKLTADELPERESVNIESETIRKLFGLLQSDVRIVVIKLVDRLHNMQTAQHLPQQRREHLARETLQIYVRVAEKLSMRAIADDLEALCLQVLEPAVFDELSNLREQQEERATGIAQIMQDAVVASTTDPREGKPIVRYDRMRWERLREIAKRESSATTGLPGISVAIICNNVDACYRALGALHQQWQREAMSFQDFINAPMINGYRGLHTTLIMEDGTRVRCKIRTADMQQYAMHGVTTWCFHIRGGAAPLTLPWASRLSSLDNDTESYSEQFLQSLRSDILGETIVIHGAGDETLSIPRGSTALDGAIYLAGDAALRCAGVSINGKDVHMQTPLKHADALVVHTTVEKTVDPQWLLWTTTGYAASRIRGALKQLEPELLEEHGKESINGELRRRGAGFLAEFPDASLSANAQKAGYDSPSDIYIAVALNYLTALDAAQLLLPSYGTVHDAQKQSTYILQCRMPNAARSTVLPLIEKVLPLQAATTYTIRSNRSVTTLHATLVLAQAEATSTLQSLQMTGATHVELVPKKQRILWGAAFCLLVTLWGMDPIVARQLLTTGIDPLNLTIVRFGTFLLASAFLVTAHRLRHRKERFNRLPLRQPMLWGAGIALFTTAVSTYGSLQYISASQYILYIMLGVIIQTLFNYHRSGSTNLFNIASSAGCVVTALLGLILAEGTTTSGVLFGIISSAGFAMYSTFSDKYQKAVGRVQARYPAFLLLLSIVVIPLTIALIPFAPVEQLRLEHIINMSTFAAVFTVLPYAVYYALQRWHNIPIRNLIAVVFITIFGEAVLEKNMMLLLLSPLAAVYWLLPAKQNSQT